MIVVIMIKRGGAPSLIGWSLTDFCVNNFADRMSSPEIFRAWRLMHKISLFTLIILAIALVGILFSGLAEV